MKEIDRKYIGKYVIVVEDYSEYPKGQMANNIKCYDDQGGLIWKIEPLNKEHVDDCDCWVGIDIIDCKIFAYNFSSIKCEIDIKDGKILSQIETR